MFVEEYGYWYHISQYDPNTQAISEPVPYSFEKPLPSLQDLRYCQVDFYYNGVLLGDFYVMAREIEIMIHYDRQRHDIDYESWELSKEPSSIDMRVWWVMKVIELLCL